MKRALLALLAWGGFARAETGNWEWKIPASLKSALQVSRPAAPGGPTADAASLWRLRLAPEFQAGSWLKGGAAYEQRLRQEGGAAAAQGMRQESAPMLRVANADAEIASGPGMLWRHELDRAWLSIEGEWGQLTAGRQGLGWGRGLIFSPADLIAPLATLEADREWRRGVDALRLNLDFGLGLSAEGLGAWGQDWQHSAWLGKVAGEFGWADMDLFGGLHLEDEIVGASFSAPLWKAEIHGEAVLHHLRGPYSGAALWGSPDLVPRGMLGASYSFGIAERSVFVAGEFFDNAFGCASARDMPSRMLEPDFAERVARGQLPSPARQAGGISLSAAYDPGLSFSTAWIFDFFDASGIFSPGLQWDLGENLSLLAQAYLPYGRGTESGVQQSHYGSNPLTAFIQMKFYL